MILVTILLPLFYNSGKRIPKTLHQSVKSELSSRFGGLTSYSRSPAEGLWQNRNRAQHEDIVVYEVIVRKPETRWWKNYRKRLESKFQQSAVIVRAQAITLL